MKKFTNILEKFIMLMSNILLVGSEGYIGSNCPIKNIKKIDLKNGQDFLTYPIDNEIQTIIFLASAKPNINQTQEDYLYNEKLYDRLDQWVKNNNMVHVIFASSAAVYGNTIKPSKENDYLEPINIYGRSKLSGEYRIREYPRHTILRFGNVYGHMQGKSGNGVTEIFMNGGNKIYGDGTQIRDFVPIRIIWNVINSAINYPVQWRGVINVGTGKGKTINEWFKGWGHGEPEYAPFIDGDVLFSTLNNNKMLERLKLCR